MFVTWLCLVFIPLLSLNSASYSFFFAASHFVSQKLQFHSVTFESVANVDASLLPTVAHSLELGDRQATDDLMAEKLQS